MHNAIQVSWIYAEIVYLLSVVLLNSTSLGCGWL